MEIVPFSVNQDPAGLHAVFRIEVEPAAIVFVAHPAGLDIATFIERPPVAVYLLPCICNAICTAFFCLRVAAVCEAQPPAVFILHPVTLSVIGSAVGSSCENTCDAVGSSPHRIPPGRSAAGRFVTSGGRALAARLVWLVGVFWLILCRWSCLTDFKCKGCRSRCVVSGFPRIKFTKIKLGFDCVGAYK